MLIDAPSPLTFHQPRIHLVFWCFAGNGVTYLFVVRENLAGRARSSTDRASDYGSEGWGFESLRAHKLEPRSGGVFFCPVRRAETRDVEGRGLALIQIEAQ